MKIVLGTNSELKVRALKSALDKLDIEAEVISRKAESNVSDQPFGYEEMIKGAKNRVENLFKDLDADIYVSIESGLVSIEGMYFDIACVYSKNKEGVDSTSFSSGYFIPEWMIDKIKTEKTELGFITQELSGDTDKDPIKYFSKGALKREELIYQAVLISLLKIFNKDKYEKI
ncbi:MAG: inosine/xanthosine triphosphatase [Candidatus Paceibacterota bacterium]